MNFLQTFADGFGPVEQFFVVMALVFLVGGLSFGLYLFASRIVKNNYLKKEAHLQIVFQSSLNLILVKSNSSLAESIYQFHLMELRRVLRKNWIIGRQVLIDQVMNMKMNLNGTSAKLLDRIYADLNLYMSSKRKLFSRSWKVKAQGLRELTKMNYYLPHDMHFLLSTSRNAVLKEEIVVASVSLNRKKPLGFLNLKATKISMWTLVNIYHHLSLYDVQLLPDFSKWFDSKNADVVLFSIRMARQFRQVNAIPSLIQLLKSADDRIVTSAIQTLADFEAFEAAKVIQPIGDAHYESESISLAVVRFLGKVGRLEEHAKAVEHYLKHTCYHVRFEAVRALMKMCNKAKRQLLLNNKILQANLDPMIKHVSEPLLT